MIPLTGFAPDLPPDTPGVITDCTHLIGNERGMQAAPAPVAVTGLGALAAECRGAAQVMTTTGTKRTIAGTQTHLYELQSGTWSDVDATVYAGGSGTRWSFAQFGNATLASNDVEQIQSSTSGTFARITTAPIAEMIVAAKDFVLAFNTNEGTFGDQSDRWWCSAFQDHSDWTPAASTQATSGRLIGAGGAITAAATLGDYVIAYKAKQMFQGQYVGPPVVWQWNVVPGDIGCVGKEAVTDIGGAHVFVGDDNIWLYDGTRAIAIGQDVRQWFYARLSQSFRYRTIVAHEKKYNRVWVFYPSTASTGNPDSAIAYHLGSKKWGRSDRTIEAWIPYISSGYTWDTLNGASATWDGLPDVPWDSSFWSAGSQAFSIFDSSHNMKSLIGAGQDCGFVTGDIGDDTSITDVNRVVLRCNTDPVSGTITGQVKTGVGAAAASGGSGTQSNSKFDIRQSGRFHRFSFLLTGDVEVTGIDVKQRVAGKR